MSYSTKAQGINYFMSLQEQGKLDWYQTITNIGEIIKSNLPLGFNATPEEYRLKFLEVFEGVRMAYNDEDGIRLLKQCVHFINERLSIKP